MTDALCCVTNNQISVLCVHFLTSYFAESSMIRCIGARRAAFGRIIDATHLTTKGAKGLYEYVLELATNNQKARLALLTTKKTKHGDAATDARSQNVFGNPVGDRLNTSIGQQPIVGEKQPKRSVSHDGIRGIGQGETPFDSKILSKISLHDEILTCRPDIAQLLDGDIRNIPPTIDAATGDVILLSSLSNISRREAATKPAPPEVKAKVAPLVVCNPRKIPHPPTTDFSLAEAIKFTVLKLIDFKELEVQSTIGSGANGVLKKAFYSVGSYSVAIEKMFGRQPEASSLAINEASLMCGLIHPNITLLIGMTQNMSDCYIVMEFIPGENLRTSIWPFKNPKTLEKDLHEAHTCAIATDLKGVPEFLVGGLECGMVRAPGNRSTAEELFDLLCKARGRVGSW
ncbi:hypothetical protein QAD02_000723 [Eretmocerus hayati]|uniref:Uncharacterized protein n=1 Tax=Eretmocerus hayati TaxID=131215 RepID=A0ACC2NEG0_9HYME|nr:hypothetical protein QAD02_000723 [Eretmocerus hayati]